MTEILEWASAVLLFFICVALIYLLIDAMQDHEDRGTLACWWFGCEQDPREWEYVDPEYATCRRCGGGISYGDMVGDTRHRRFMRALSRINPMRLLPEKCPHCGLRRGHKEGFGCDIPF